MKEHLLILDIDDLLKQSFPLNMFSTIYKNNKNLKEILAPSKYLDRKNGKQTKSYAKF